MATEGQGRATQAPALTSLPRVEDLPIARDGYDQDKVREAFEAFRRHTTQLQVQLRVLQAADQSGIEPTGHAVRLDSLHLIRAAAEMADTIERDAQSASATQLRRTEEEVSKRQRELKEREGEVERHRNESERQRAEILNAAKAEARQTTQEAEQQAAQEIKEAESRAARLLEQARHQATELTNSARAEVEQTLEWARSQAGAIIHRAQEGAEQLLGAAGLGDEVVGRVAESIVGAAEAAAEASRGGPERSQLRAPEAVDDEPPVSPPVSPGPPPPSPEAQDSESEPKEPKSDGNDDG
jgi:F0F1-type ATP synthase membrane subunit b/b'